MRYAFRRILGIIPVLFFTWTVVFIVLQMIPGDPVNLMLADVPTSEELRERERIRLGLDRPIAEQAPATLQLAAGGLAVGLSLGFILGMVAGLNPNTWIDTVCMVIALAGISLPSFWIGMMLIYLFGMTLGWVPIVGSGLSALILPSISVGLYIAGGSAHLVRASMIEAMSQDYIRTARAKGLSRGKIAFEHALRNALIPPVTLLGIQIAVLIGGAVVTENVIARPGLGTMLVDAVLTKDLPLVQALVVYTTAVYVLINLIVDLLYGVIDPRVQARRARPIVRFWPRPQTPAVSAPWRSGQTSPATQVPRLAW